VRRPKSVRPHGARAFADAMAGARITGVRRRAKFLLFDLEFAGGGVASGRAGGGRPTLLIGHLGMTGRMFIARADAPLPRHAAVVLELDEGRFVFEDTRYFGRLTLDTAAMEGLGPEPLEPGFDAGVLAANLAGSRQAVKVRLLDQSVVAGVGNIYASEALHRAGLSPRRAAGRLKGPEVARLCGTIREVLAEAVRFGSTVPLDFPGATAGGGDGLFYYGSSPAAAGSYEERLRVYDRAGEPCPGCGAGIRRIVQAGRSTYFCPQCQR